VANIGYARCSTLAQDLTAQRQALAALGILADRIYLDKGLTGTSRARPGLDQALAAVREGDTLTVTKLDRLARSVPDALDILGQLSARGVRFALGGSTYDWDDPFARMFLQILAVIAEFEANLIRQRTREGMDIARQNGKLRGKQPRLKPAQDREIRRMHDSGDYNVAEIAGLFGVSRPTVYRSLERTVALPPLPADIRGLLAAYLSAHRTWSPAALFARLWLSRSVTDPVGLTVAKPFRTPSMCTSVNGVKISCWNTDRRLLRVTSTRRGVLVLQLRFFGR
jgi:DNA invertase Pin-like site-specific DNA recombinase